MHAVTAHIPTQFELACLRSLNAESQERLFGQARTIAESCTNHHPDNVIPQIMLRLQAKQEQHEFLASVNKGDSQVSHVARDMPHLSGTRVKSSFIKQREDCWQVHLQRISPFLVAGVDVWWSYTSNGFLFHDGDTDPSNPSNAFSLMHYRSHSIMDVENRRDTCWEQIVDDKIAIPAHSIKLFDSDGNKTGRLLYNNDHTVTVESSDTLTATIEAPNQEILATPTSLNPVGEVNTLCTELEVSDNTCRVDPPLVAQKDSESSVADTVAGTCLGEQSISDTTCTAESYAAATGAGTCSGDQSTSSCILNPIAHNEGLKT